MESGLVHQTIALLQELSKLKSKSEDLEAAVRLRIAAAIAILSMWIDLQAFRVRQRQVKASRSAADDRWAKIVAGVRIVNDRFFSLHADRARCPKVESRCAAAG